MYKLFLTLRYLLHRRITIVPILAVMLCVAMDLIVASVMGGFLDEVRSAARGLFGDVIVSDESLSGFGYYDTWTDADGKTHDGLIQYIRRQKEVAQATPVIETFGMIRLPEQKGFSKPVNVLGIVPDQYAQVTDYQKSLYYQNSPNWTGLPSFDQVPDPVTGKPVPLQPPGATTAAPKGLVLGVRVLWPKRDEKGGFPREELRPGTEPVQLTVAPIRASGMADTQGAVTRNFYLVDTSHTRIQQIDQMACYVPFRDLQEYLEMGASARPDKDGFLSPARATRVLVKTAPGYTTDQCRDAVARAVKEWKRDRLTRLFGAPDAARQKMQYYEPFTWQPPDYVVRAGDTIHLRFPGQADLNQDLAVADDGSIRPLKLDAAIRVAGLPLAQVRAMLAMRYEPVAHGGGFASVVLNPNFGVQAKVWEEANEKYFSAIENQRFIALLMVGVVSLTAIALVWVIFVMIVVEKTKDIGIVKSVGGSAGGVMAIFLIWAGLIGLIGTVLGGALGSLFVAHIMGIEQWLSHLLHTELWDPSAYLFETIPARFRWNEMLTIGGGAVLAAMLGALLPAFRAGRMSPVDALRWE
ncbi:MAG: hypothetical protein BIFFINMI_02876 [Phycisphaerae bacterium]|nr:hypothetical protein [Phycisphaerae bacterium]